MFVLHWCQFCSSGYLSSCLVAEKCFLRKESKGFQTWNLFYLSFESLLQHWDVISLLFISCIMAIKWRLWVIIVTHVFFFFVLIFAGFWSILVIDEVLLSISFSFSLFEWLLRIWKFKPFSSQNLIFLSLCCILCNWNYPLGVSGLLVHILEDAEASTSCRLCSEGDLAQDWGRGRYRW